MTGWMKACPPQPQPLRTGRTLTLSMVTLLAPLSPARGAVKKFAAHSGWLQFPLRKGGAPKITRELSWGSEGSWKMLTALAIPIH